MFQHYRNAFRGLPVAVWWFSVAALVNRAGTMVLPFLALYLRDELSLDVTKVGWILVAFGGGSLAGNYGSGFFVDRYGGHAIQVATLVLSGFAFLGLMMLTSFPALMVGMFVTAAVSDAFRPAVMASIAQATEESNRARSFGLLRLAINAGMAIGPSLGGVLAEIDFRWIFIGDGVTSLFAAVVLARMPRRFIGGPSKRARPATETSPIEVSKGPWRDGPFLAFITIVLVLMVAFFQLFFTLALYLKDVYGWSERDVGLLIGLNATIIVLFELPLVAALEKKAPLWIYALGSVAIGAGFAVFLLGVHPVVPISMMLIVTIGEMLVFPTSSVVVSNRASPEWVGRYMSVYGTSIAIRIHLGTVARAHDLQRTRGVLPMGWGCGRVLCFGRARGRSSSPILDVADRHSQPIRRNARRSISMPATTVVGVGDEAAFDGSRLAADVAAAGGAVRRCGRLDRFTQGAGRCAGRLGRAAQSARRAGYYPRRCQER